MSLVKRLLAGEPVELTEASQEVVDLLSILEGDCVIDDKSGEHDLGSCIYWNEPHTVAVYVPTVEDNTT